MAAYCEVADVQAEFKSITFESDDAVKEESIETFIDQATAEIDATLSVTYVVPVTAGPSALLLLKQICTWLAAQRVKDIIEVKNARTEVEQDVRKDMAALARKMLMQIVKGDIQLMGADLAATTQMVHTFTSSNTSPRIFKKNEDQW